MNGAATIFVRSALATILLFLIWAVGSLCRHYVRQAMADFDRGISEALGEGGDRDA